MVGRQCAPDEHPVRLEILEQARAWDRTDQSGCRSRAAPATPRPSPGTRPERTPTTRSRSRRSPFAAPSSAPALRAPLAPTCTPARSSRNLRGTHQHSLEPGSVQLLKQRHNRPRRLSRGGPVRHHCHPVRCPFPPQNRPALVDQPRRDVEHPRPLPIGPPPAAERRLIPDTSRTSRPRPPAPRIRLAHRALRRHRPRPGSTRPPPGRCSSTPTCRPCARHRRR